MSHQNIMNNWRLFLEGADPLLKENVDFARGQDSDTMDIAPDISTGPPPRSPFDGENWKRFAQLWNDISREMLLGLLPYLPRDGSNEEMTKAGIELVKYVAFWIMGGKVIQMIGRTAAGAAIAGAVKKAASYVKNTPALKRLFQLSLGGGGAWLIKKATKKYKEISSRDPNSQIAQDRAGSEIDKIGADLDEAARATWHEVCQSEMYPDELILCATEDGEETGIIAPGESCPENMSEIASIGQLCKKFADPRLLPSQDGVPVSVPGVPGDPDAPPAPSSPLSIPDKPFSPKKRVCKSPPGSEHIYFEIPGNKPCPTDPDELIKAYQEWEKEREESLRDLRRRSRGETEEPVAPDVTPMQEVLEKYRRSKKAHPILKNVWWYNA